MRISDWSSDVCSSDLELIAEAVRSGARRIIVGVGGSACTDGGAGAVQVLTDLPPLDGSVGIEVLVAVDVTTRFADAAKLFAPQKGATPEQCALLDQRPEDRKSVV